MYEKPRGFRGLFRSLEEKVHPIPLKERVDQALYRLATQKEKLEHMSSRLQQRDKEMFQRCIGAQLSKDNAHAALYANECAEIRKMAHITLSSELALERVVLRLQTIEEFGDVMAQIAPVIGVVRETRGRIAGVIPEVATELGEVNNMLSDMSLETGEVQDQDLDLTASSSEAKKVLEESNIIASQQIKERFPELPLPEPRQTTNATVTQVTQARIPVAIASGGEEEQVEPLEDRVLGYIKSHNGELNMNSASTDLAVSPEDVRRSLQKLRDDGKDSKNIKFDQWVLTEKPDISWDDIADLEKPKRAIEESIVFPVRRPDLFPLGWPRGILFFGPPGCGKTLLAAAVASEIKGVFFCADAASLMSKWLGESERNVSQLFVKARESSEKGQPAIVFIDEIDSLMGFRCEEVGGEVRVRNQFLKEMDGILDKKRNYHVYVIGATNKPWVLDEPFIRRFQKRIYVPLPDIKARMDMFQIYAHDLKLDNNVDFAELARVTEGYSGGDIRDLFQSTQLKVVRNFFTHGNVTDLASVPDPITMEDFQSIVTGRRPSVSQTILKRYYDWDESFKAS